MTISLEEHRRGVRPVVYAIFEREPQKCSATFLVLFGPYDTPEDAEAARLRYCGDDPNCYVDTYPQS